MLLDPLASPAASFLAFRGSHGAKLCARITAPRSYYPPVPFLLPLKSCSLERGKKKWGVQEGMQKAGVEYLDNYRKGNTYTSRMNIKYPPPRAAPPPQDEEMTITKMPANQSTVQSQPWVPPP